MSEITLPEEYEEYLNKQLSWIESITEKLSPTDEYLRLVIHTLLRISRQFADLTITPDGISPVRAVPILTPRDAVDLCYLTAPEGRLKVLSIALAISIPAGTTVDMAFRVEENWASIFRTPMLWTSNYYDDDLTIQAWMEQDRIPVTQGAIPFNGPRTLDIGFAIKRFGMDFQYVNNTPIDAIVTVECSDVFMEEQYCEEFYVPLMNYIYRKAKEPLS